MTTTSKALLQATAINIHYNTLPKNWTMTDEEVVMLNDMIAAEKGGGGENGGLVIDEYTRVDSNTKRLITEGYVVFGGDYYFASEADAHAMLAQEGFSPFDEVGDDEEGNFYFTQWYEKGYSSLSEPISA